MNQDLQSFFQDLKDLYCWMDSIYQVNCPSGCNVCCTRDIIWMLTPELVLLNTKAKPRKVECGCPFRTDCGCSVYEYRPLVCRSFGSDLIRGEKVVSLTVTLNEGVQEIAGPGICHEKKPPSTCNVQELNKIYACYAALSEKYGLIAIGSCDDFGLQVSQCSFIREMQTKCPDYQIYVPDGIPVFFNKKLEKMYSYIF